MYAPRTSYLLCLAALYLLYTCAGTVSRLSALGPSGPESIHILKLKLFYLVKFFPVHLMSSGTDHSSMAAKAVAIHNANDVNVDAEAHKPSQTLNAHDTNVDDAEAHKPSLTPLNANDLDTDAVYIASAAGEIYNANNLDVHAAAHKPSQTLNAHDTNVDDAGAHKPSPTLNINDKLSYYSQRVSDLRAQKSELEATYEALMTQLDVSIPNTLLTIEDCMRRIKHKTIALDAAEDQLERAHLQAERADAEIKPTAEHTQRMSAAPLQPRTRTLTRRPRSARRRRVRRRRR